MIEILTLAASVTKIAGAISTGIKAGKDVASLMPSVGKLGELDAQIQIAETGQHKGILRKLASTEQEAYAISSAKIAHKKAMDELRSQLAEIAVQNNELKAHAHEQQLELVKCTAVVETQKTILTELQGHLGVKKRE